jgi:hypothetical protein
MWFRKATGGAALEPTLNSLGHASDDEKEEDLESAGIGQPWERATAGNEPDLISYPHGAPRNEGNQWQVGKLNCDYVWPPY